AYRNQREVTLVPHLRQVERVVWHLLSLLLGHHLNEHLPFWEIAIADGLEEISLVALPIFPNQHFSLCICQVLDSLLGNEVELHPMTHVVAVDEAVGVAA